MGLRLFGNRALILCLAGIDYEMLKLGSDGLVLGIRTLLTQDGQRYNKLLNLVPKGMQLSYSATIDLMFEFWGHSFPKVLAIKLGKSSSSHYWVYEAFFLIGFLLECLSYKIINSPSSRR
ncbi:hypothetical protein M9H77_08343 [Catharanthus roseus]|uniref:Uncharacterized protein n=1 Tax=Catharanthus roseus TaxID=4058 RepID=A0ACC0BXH8_CATRO|nr:hypothetical protein M9H77_08343 [Catharanthus roseus]